MRELIKNTKSENFKRKFAIWQLFLHVPLFELLEAVPPATQTKVHARKVANFKQTPLHKNLSKNKNDTVMPL